MPRDMKSLAMIIQLIQRRMEINKSSLLTLGLALFPLSYIHTQPLKEIGISSKKLFRRDDI